MLAAASTSSRVARPLARSASTIASKYAHAAYSAALKQSPASLNKVHGELTAIGSAIKSTPNLAAFIKNPTLTAKDRSAGINAIFAAAGGAKKEQVSDITKNLFAVMSENGRLGETHGVIETVNALVSKYRGELEVVVTSAAPLPRDALTRLETSLKQSQAALQAKSVKITNKVNPSVLGGIVVDFGEKTIDLSVASRVNKLNSLLQQSV